MAYKILLADPICQIEMPIPAFFSHENIKTGTTGKAILPVM